MKKKSNYFIVFIILIFYVFGYMACTTLSKAVEERHPGFFANSNEYFISHDFPRPFVVDLTQYQGSSQDFDIRNKTTNHEFQVQVDYLHTPFQKELENNLKNKIGTASYTKIMDQFLALTDSLTDFLFHDTLELRGFLEDQYFYQATTFFSPVSQSNYCILSKVFYYQDRLQAEQDPIDIESILLPIDYWIFEEDRLIGDISLMPEAKFLDELSYVWIFEIALRDRIINVEFQDTNYKRRTAFKHFDELIAFVDEKPPKPVAKGYYKELEGSLFINKHLSEDLNADVFVAYIISDMAIRNIKAEASNPFD